MLSLSFSLKLVFVFDLDLTWRTREGNRKITSLWLKWTPRTGQSKLGREMIPSYDNELLRDFISRGVSFRRRLLQHKKERFSLPLVSFSFSRSDSLIKRKRKKKRETGEKQTGISRNKSSWDTKNTDVSDVSFRTKYREDAWEGKTWVLISFLSLKEREGFLSFKSLWRIQVLSSQSKILLSLSLPLLFPIIITNNISIIINMSSFLPSSWSPPSSGFLLPDQVKLQSQKKKENQRKENEENETWTTSNEVCKDAKNGISISWRNLDAQRRSLVWFCCCFSFSFSSASFERQESFFLFLAWKIVSFLWKTLLSSFTCFIHEEDDEEGNWKWIRQMNQPNEWTKRGECIEDDRNIILASLETMLILHVILQQQ